MEAAAETFASPFDLPSPPRLDSDLSTDARAAASALETAVDLVLLDDRIEVGEVLYKGESLMVGYWARPEATAEAIRDGWFHTGDAGYLDTDGFLFIKDRLKDMIVTGSENVYPAEIEAVLYQHPDIVEAAVIGVPDSKWGESVKAVVVMRDGAPRDEAILIEWTRDKLAGYKRPRSVDFVDALPRNGSGKLLKRKLREPYWAGYERNVN